MKILFFGSTGDSVIVADRLFAHKDVTIAAVVTQPPRPVGRDQTITPTPVETWAKQHTIPVLTFPSDKGKPWLYEQESTVIDTLAPFEAELLISASYGQLIPTQTIASATYHGLNVHPSLLPRWRGADPVPWAIATGDHQTGVTVVTLSPEFDQGKIIAQKKVPIKPDDTSDPLRTQLFEIGAKLLVEVLADYISGKLHGDPQDKSGTPYARRLTRDDGYEPWEAIEKAATDEKEAGRIERKFRAFTPWPGLWTLLRGKRVKILACHLTDHHLSIDQVQLEGKKPVPYDEFARAYLAPSKNT